MPIVDLKSFDKIYPIFVQKYETYIPSEEVSGTVEKINSIITYLNQIGRLSNDVVSNWNKVMVWVMGEGLTETVEGKIDAMLLDGIFATLLDGIVNEKVVTLDALVDVKIVELETMVGEKITELETILVDLRDNGTGIDAQARADLVIANQQLAEKAEYEYVDTKVASIASGSPSGAYLTLSDLQTAFPTGTTGIYVITADGNWYYWDGLAWSSGGVYQTTQWLNATTTQNATWSVI